MNRLEQHLIELKIAVKNPRIYLVSHFDNIRNQIDIACQTYLNKADLPVESKEGAIKQQDEMINEAALF